MEGQLKRVISSKTQANRSIFYLEYYSELTRLPVETCNGQLYGTYESTHCNLTPLVGVPRDTRHPQL